MRWVADLGYDLPTYMVTVGAPVMNISFISLLLFEPPIGVEVFGNPDPGAVIESFPPIGEAVLAVVVIILGLLANMDVL